MNYEKRLMKFLKDFDGLFAVWDIAAIWKRREGDISIAALRLKQDGKIKVAGNGVLSLKGKYAKSM